MCYHPIDVVNPSKYVSLKYRDRYIMQVPCGKCAACMTAKSNEWVFRLYHEALDTFGNGFCLFDTLTYDNDHLPHISDYWSVPPSLDFPCFSSRDLRLFVADLRQRCKRKFGSNFSYFITSEYGTSERHLHRPHYHVLFFVRGPIKPLEFSELVSAVWSRGRTDGIPWQTVNHVLNNVFDSMTSGAMRSLKYVCKYIQKSCTFQKQIDYRLDMIMKDISSKFFQQGLEFWSDSSHYWRVRESIARKLNQFHRQSTHLGECALRDFDISDIIESGSVIMPDNELVIRQLPLPTYYKRKLFYDLVDVDGAKSWQPNELGLQFIESRLSSQLVQLTDKLNAVKVQLKLDYDSNDLADYVLNFRGRIKAQLPESTLYERYNDVDFYNYVNRYDKEWFSGSGLSLRWLGNSSIGYSRSFDGFRAVKQFIAENVCFDGVKEDILQRVFDFLRSLDDGRQRLYEQTQRLSNLMHFCFG